MHVELVKDLHCKRKNGKGVREEVELMLGGGKGVEEEEVELVLREKQTLK